MVVAGLPTEPQQADRQVSRRLVSGQHLASCWFSKGMAGIRCRKKRRPTVATVVRGRETRAQPGAFFQRHEVVAGLLTEPQRAVDETWMVSY